MTEQTTITVGTPSPELISNAEAMLAIANSYKIDCQEMRECASEDLKRVKALTRDVEAQEEEITRPLMKAHKAVKALFRKPLDFLGLAESTIKREAMRWDNEQDRIRREAQAEAARKADEERKRLQAEADKARTAGNTETAHAIQQAAQMVAPVPVPVHAPKIAGESKRDVWSAECYDLVALARAVADGLVPADNIMANVPVLNQQARALKAALAIPGVRAVNNPVLASRAA